MNPGVTQMSLQAEEGPALAFAYQTLFGYKGHERTLRATCTINKKGGGGALTSHAKLILLLCSFLLCLYSE